MTRGNRIISTFVLLGLLIPGFNGTARSQSDPSPEASGKTFTISGTIGLANATLTGFPGTVRTDENGMYSVEVPEGWHGTVKPVKLGYAFEPPFRSYTAIARDYQSEDYAAMLLTFTISGNVGVPGVRMQGFPVEIVTDARGNYEVRVDHGWSGRVTPIKEGYRFEPPARQYTQVARNQEKEDHRASVLTFTISGSVGLPGVTMRGFPGNVVTNENGRYSVDLMYGWTGQVTPHKLGYVFEPASRSYLKVTDALAQQDYVPKVLTYMISGNAGAPGVIMRGLPRQPITDPQGNYRAQVEYGWSSIVSPSKEGFSFTPPARTYNPITTNLSNENYAAHVWMVTISNVIMFNGEPVRGLMLVAEPGGYSAVTDSSGRYTVKVPCGWSGRLLPQGDEDEIPGRIPPISYVNVTSDIIDGSRASAPADSLATSRRVSETVPPAGAIRPMGDVLVIPTADVVPDDIAETTEDLRVMLHILREKLSEPRMILGVLRDYGGFFDSDRKVEALYLQGTAAMFVVEVDFPYSFPTQQSSQGDTREEAVDPVWQRAKERLYSPVGSRSYGQSSQSQAMTFEQFKDELLGSLKHTANVRHIDPNELVILTIIAQNEEAGWPGSTVSGRAAAPLLDPDGRPRVDALGRPIARSATSTSGTTVLTMQAKKADIDAFAKGDFDFEQFRQRVRTFAY